VYGFDIPRSLEDVCDPRRLALIVYDMQIGILRQIANGAEITARVAAVLAAAREAGVRIVFMRHLSMPKELMGVVQFRMAMAWQRAERAEDVHPWFLRDAPGFPIAPELVSRTSEAIFDKITMSAFEGTPWTPCCATPGSMRSQLSAWPPRSASSPPFATASISATSQSSSETLAARGTSTPASDRSRRFSTWAMHCSPRPTNSRRSYTVSRWRVRAQSAEAHVALDVDARGRAAVTVTSEQKRF
jgi:hypothetical protein